MKKLLLIFLVFFLYSQVSANDWRTQIGETIKNEFRVNNKMRLPLDTGEWLAIDKSSEMVTNGIGFDSITFVQMKDNVPIKAIDIGRATGLRKWQAYLTNIIEAAVFAIVVAICIFLFCSKAFLAIASFFFSKDLILANDSADLPSLRFSAAIC